ATIDSRLQKKYDVYTAISSVLGCPLRDADIYDDDEEEDRMVLWASCDFRLHRSGTLLHGRFGTRPIRDLQNHVPDLESTIVVMVPQHGVVHCDPPPDKTHDHSPGGTCFFLLEQSGQFPDVLQFEYGYARRSITLVVGALGFLLLVPLGITFWFRGHARTAPEERKPAVWFAYRRFLLYTALFGSLLCLASVDVLGADQLVKFLLLPAGWSDPFAGIMLAWILIWIPPVVVYFICLGVAAPLQRLRGTSITQKQILQRSFWGVARFVFPMVFLSFGIMELFHSPRLGIT